MDKAFGDPSARPRKGHGKNNSAKVLARSPVLALVTVALLLGGPPRSRAKPDSRRRTKRSTKFCRDPKTGKRPDRPLNHPASATAPSTTPS